ncbi:sulfate ABC transporter [Mycobacterium tuberculosis]|nr:sulfate ABC transporter [Mycobacterium tuberculosis]
MTSLPAARYLVRSVALGYVFVLLIVPVALILWRTFEPGFGQFTPGSVPRRRYQR